MFAFDIKCLTRYGISQSSVFVVVVYRYIVFFFFVSWKINCIGCMTHFLLKYSRIFFPIFLFTCSCVCVCNIYVCEFMFEDIRIWCEVVEKEINIVDVYLFILFKRSRKKLLTNIHISGESMAILVSTENPLPRINLNATH